LLETLTQKLYDYLRECLLLRDMQLTIRKSPLDLWGVTVSASLP
jgi:hypothetical protein